MHTNLHMCIHARCMTTCTADTYKVHMCSYACLKFETSTSVIRYKHSKNVVLTVAATYPAPAWPETTTVHVIMLSFFC